MTTRVAVNGFGRIGRLATRVLVDRPELGLELVHVNEIGGGAEACAHLLEFDSVHGRWDRRITAAEDAFAIGDRLVGVSAEADPAALDWEALGVDVVLEATGRLKTAATLQPHLDRGARKVVVAAPVHDPAAANIVMGVNEEAYLPDLHAIVTAASCTTNCLAPVVKALHEAIGIRHGQITTLHDQTNTQTIVDRPHRDLRRARASSLSLIPTTTGSAQAIGLIFPELLGRLDGVAMRVPLLNASLTDCVFELARETTPAEVNEVLRAAAEGPLRGILGYEERPLVSIDYRTDPRSGIVDAPSTRVIAGTQAKVLAWYDNEWGYANRYAELAALVARLLPAG